MAWEWRNNSRRSLLFLEWSRETDRPLWRGTCHPKGPPQVPHQLVTPERQITVGPLSSPTWQDDSNRCLCSHRCRWWGCEGCLLWPTPSDCLAKLHHTTSPSSSPMPMPLCLAVIGPLTHLSAQFLLTGLQTTTVIAYSFSATTTISVLPIPGFPESLSITGHGTVQMAEPGKRRTIFSSLDAGSRLSLTVVCTEEQSLATQTIACWWPSSS